MKRTRFLLLALLMLCSNLTWAYSFIVDGIAYTKLGNNKVEVTYDYEYYNDGIVEQYIRNLYEGEIIIPTEISYKGENFTVTGIDYTAFQNCRGLTSISIPNSVTSIGNQAFQNCTGLTSIIIPNSVTWIGEDAFDGCENLSVVINLSNLNLGGNYGISPYDVVLNFSNAEFIDDFIFNNGTLGRYIGNDTNIILPDNYNGKNYSIGKKAFEGCTGLTSITIPNSVTSIGNRVFFGCTGLTSITIPNSVTSIGESAFQECTGLTHLTIENCDAEIGQRVFEKCISVKELCINGEKFPSFSGLTGVEKIILGDKIKEVADDAFNNYPILNTLEFHCKRIYDWNFGTSILTDVILGEEVAVIFGGAFEEIETLERLKVEAIVPPIADDNTFSRLQYRMLEVSVPEIAIEDYKADEVWKKFSSIKGYVPTGIEDAVAETSNDVNIRICANGLRLENADGMPVAVYRINGKLVVRQTNYNGEIFSLPKGIYVVRVGKTTKKVVVK